MAAHLTLGIALAIALGTPRVLAQGLSDPMRPPREIIGESAAAYEPAGGWSPVQVVIISKDRRQATINGRTVNLGERYGNATVVGISDEVLDPDKGDATEVIKLYSSVNRRRRHWPAAQEQTETAEQREKGTHEAN